MLTCGRRCGEILLPRGARELSSIVPPMLQTLRENSCADGAGSHRGQCPGRPAAAAPPPAGAKAAKCKGRPVPQLEDVTAKTGIIFKHAADPAKKYIVESMSGAVIVFDYDRDGWPDIYFTNAPTVEMAIKGQKTRGALYHNNHDGTFTDVTDKASLVPGGELHRSSLPHDVF
jgi:hypothetical protein